MVKEFQDEFFVRQCLVLDTFTTDLARFEDMVSVAASLLTAVENRDGLMDLCFQANRPELITAGRGYAQTSQQLEALATLAPDATGSEDFLLMLHERARLMSGCLLVLSCVDDMRQQLVDAVESRGVHTAVFVITDPEDNTPLRADYHRLNLGDIEAGLAQL